MRATFTVTSPSPIDAHARPLSGACQGRAANSSLSALAHAKGL